MSEKDIKKKLPNKPKRPKGSMIMYVVYGVIIITLCSMLFGGGSSFTREIDWAKFEPILTNHYYEKIVVVNEEFAEITMSKDALKRADYKELYQQSLLGQSPEAGIYKYNIGDYSHFDKMLEHLETTTGCDHINYEVETRSNPWKEILVLFGPLLFFVVIIIVMNRMSMKQMGGGSGGGIFSVGKSKAKVYEGKDANQITFKDVAGLVGAKEEVVEVVDFLKNPKRYTDLGGKIPKGVLLVGPPGTGKTLLAKAVAGEANVPFFSMSGSDFVEMFVGVGASRVRDLFEEAKKKAPCIVFIDEIDAVGRARGRAGLSNANDERENTLNQLLTEMDGFGSTTNVIVMAATNRADVLDKALLRAGRFDRQIYVELPDLEERKAIFGVHMKKIKYAEGIDVENLSKQTAGFCGADIANVCNEAALCAARKNKKQVEMQDFLDAIDRIVGGLEKKTKVLTEEEKYTIAYHESGHASVSWLLQYADPFVKVTIVPRGKALGAAWYLPSERQILSYEQMFHEMITLMAGRAAEEVVFNRVCTGALNDMERATKMAQSMVLYYGMSPEIGNISFYDSTGQSDWNFTKPFSEKTAELIDAEVKRIVTEAYEKAKQLIIENRDKLDQLAALLFEKEVLFRADLENIYGPRPWKDDVPELSNKAAEQLAASNTENANPESDSMQDAPSETAEQESDDNTPQA